MSAEEIIFKFVSIGLSEQKAKETLKNNSVSKFLLSAINEVSCIIFKHKHTPHRFIGSFLLSTPAI